MLAPERGAADGVARGVRDGRRERKRGGMRLARVALERVEHGCERRAAARGPRIERTHLSGEYLEIVQVAEPLLRGAEDTDERGDAGVHRGRHELERIAQLLDGDAQRM